MYISPRITTLYVYSYAYHIISLSTQLIHVGIYEFMFIVIKWVVKKKFKHQSKVNMWCRDR